MPPSSRATFTARLRQRPPGTWVVFSDASVDVRTGRTGLGGVVFDEHGRCVIDVSVQAAQRTRDTTVAELWALQHILDVAFQHGAKQVMAWLDCQPSVEAVNGRPSCSNAPHEVEATLQRLANFSQWSCAWTPRHRLSVPNDLARRALGKPPENRTQRTVGDWLDVGAAEGTTTLPDAMVPTNPVLVPLSSVDVDAPLPVRRPKP